jgi:hypothetical protein
MRYGSYIRIKGGPNQFLEESSKRKIMEQDIEKQIWEFIDGHCDDAEKAFLVQQIAENPVWSDKYKELRRVHEMLQNEELEMPSLRFTKNVMDEIAQYNVAPATKNYINKSVIRGIFAFFLVMIGGLFIYFVSQIHWNSQSTGNLLPTFSEDTNKLNWSKILTSSYVNIFTGISAMLGLILLDKYMQAKKNLRRTDP